MEIQLLHKERISQVELSKTVRTNMLVNDSLDYIKTGLEANVNLYINTVMQITQSR